MCAIVSVSLSCVSVYMCVSVVVCLFVCFVFVFVFASKRTRAILKRRRGGRQQEFVGHGVWCTTQRKRVVRAEGGHAQAHWK